MSTKQLYASYYAPYNSDSIKKTQFDYNQTIYNDVAHEKLQEHKKFPKNRADIGVKYVFDEDALSKMFFSEDNMARLQRKIKEEIYKQTDHVYKLVEDQDESDLLVAMRAIFMEHGKYRSDRIVHQVKILNKLLIDAILPDMISMIKQEYAYLKEINEPIKPIMRPINVSRAGRRTLPSVTTVWDLR